MIKDQGSAIGHENIVNADGLQQSVPTHGREEAEPGGEFGGVVSGMFWRGLEVGPLEKVGVLFSQVNVETFRSARSLPIVVDHTRFEFVRRRRSDRD
jgi:hypothetical protein